MSMFYELMMRKKEEIMYATIKGTLTENNGVFSGFTYNNYLVTQEEFDYSKDFEIVLKTNAGNLSLTSYKIIIRSNSGSNAGASGCAIGIENQKLRSYMINSEGGYIANGSFGVSSFVNDADYFFKFSQKIDNGIYTIKLETSTDGINWTTENSWTSSLPIRNSGQGIAFGGGGFSSTTQYWAGSIDLPNSYIKLGSTKYNLQAVVGYTVVGSPTITDGVVSGFTQYDYVQTTQGYDFANINTFEQVCKFNSGKIGNFTDVDKQKFVARTSNLSNRYQWLIYANNSKLSIYYPKNSGGSYSMASSFSMQSNTIYWAKITYEKINNNGIVKLYFSLDGINYNFDKEMTITEIPTNSLIANNFIFGRNDHTDTDVNWAIYIKDSYIKINNKLWFNGQQA